MLVCSYLIWLIWIIQCLVDAYSGSLILIIWWLFDDCLYLILMIWCWFSYCSFSIICDYWWLLVPNYTWLIDDYLISTPAAGSSASFVSDSLHMVPWHILVMAACARGHIAARCSRSYS